MTQSNHDQGARRRGERIPDPGLLDVGKIKAGLEAFAVPGAIKATIERS
jgi:hypothetical protein